MSIEKASIDHEKQQVTMLEEVALAGHVATDDAGHALLARDVAAEMDIHIIPVLALLYLFCFIDRANIGNAKLAGLEKDLGMKGYQYNILLTAFCKRRRLEAFGCESNFSLPLADVAYAVFEIPMTLLCKKFGPSRFIPLCTVGFGLFAMCSGFITTFEQGIAVRFLLGICEGAIFPGIAYYLTRFYRKDELAFRVAMYVVSAPLAGAFGGLLASGILKLHSVGMYKSWRMIFIIEGIITIGLGIGSFFLLSESPETASWLTPEEKALATARIKGENLGSTVVVDKMSGKAVMDGAFSPTTLMIALIFLLDNITVQGLGFFLPTIIKTIYPKKTLIQLQLQTVPPYIVGSFFTVGTAYLAFKTNRRALWMVLSAPLIVIGYILFVTVHHPQVRYGATFLIAAGAFAFGALTVAWASANTTSDSMRAGAISTVVMGGNLGGLCATWTYRRGHSVNIGTGCGILVLTAGLWAWQVQQNRRKELGHDDHILDGKSTEEIEHLGRRHPAFRYLH
ncbi:hypothetical protein P7C70_g7898, partial [Phenoliferia sp. Uapishka_3]